MSLYDDNVSSQIPMHYNFKQERQASWKWHRLQTQANQKSERPSFRGTFFCQKLDRIQLETPTKRSAWLHHICAPLNM